MRLTNSGADAVEIINSYYYNSLAGRSSLWTNLTWPVVNQFEQTVNFALCTIHKSCKVVNLWPWHFLKQNDVRYLTKTVNIVIYLINYLKLCYVLLIHSLKFWWKDHKSTLVKQFNFAVYKHFYTLSQMSSQCQANDVLYN